MNIINIAPGVDLLFIQNDRFKTERISVNFYLPLQKDKMAQRSLLPQILTSESAAYPDFTALNRKLCSLYSAEISGSAEKPADFQKINIDCCYLSEATVGGGISDEVLKLLFELIFNPNFENGVFCKESVEREKRLTCERIIAHFNNKRAYAISQIYNFAFAGEAFGELSTGSLEAVKGITPKSLTDAYFEMLQSAYVLIVAVAPKLTESVKNTFAKAFSEIDRKVTFIPESQKLKAQNPPKTLNEKADVKQAKYVMLFASDCRFDNRQKAVANIFCDIFGGGTYSLLFSVVREKMNLCYYCASRLNARKGFLMVDSGVDGKNLTAAHEGILQQLEKIKSGDFDDEIIEKSKITVTSALKAADDSSAAISGFYSGRFDSLITPDEYAELINSVTKEEVCDMAKRFALSHTYTLSGRESDE